MQKAKSIRYTTTYGKMVRIAGELHALSSSERNIGDKKLTPTCTLWPNKGILRLRRCGMLLLIAGFEVALSVSARGPIQSRL